VGRVALAAPVGPDHRSPRYHLLDPEDRRCPAIPEAPGVPAHLWRQCLLWVLVDLWRQLARDLLAHRSLPYHPSGLEGPCYPADLVAPEVPADLETLAAPGVLVDLWRLLLRYLPSARADLVGQP